MENKLSGVYLLFDHDELVYVGQSKNILSRVGSHAARNDKDFTQFVVLQPDDPEDRFALESFLIKLLQPKYNSERTRRRQNSLTKNELGEQLPVLMDELRNSTLYRTDGNCKIMRDMDFRNMLNRLFPWWSPPPSVFKEALKDEGWIDDKKGKGIRFKSEKVKSEDRNSEVG